MYTVLIVDDEKIICEGIKSKINRIENLEVKDILIASNGIEALKAIKENNPDIMITDIKMPQMSGIELIKQTANLNKDIKFIVLSGYDDYQYVRDAFRLGAIDYLLKPVSTSELEERLKSAIKKIKDEDSLKDLRRIQDNKNLKYSIEKKLNKIFISSDLSDYKLEKLFLEIQTKLSYKYFCIGIVSFYGNNHAVKDSVISDGFIEHISQRFFDGDRIKVININDYKDNAVIVFNFTESEDYCRFVNFLQDLIKLIKNMTESAVIASISSISDNIKYIKTLYDEAFYSLSYRIIKEPYQVIEYKSIANKPSKFLLDKKDLQYLESIVNLQSINKVSEFIDKWFSRDKLKDQSIENINRLYEFLNHKIMDLMTDEQLIYINEDIKDFNSFNTLEDLKYYLKNHIFKVKQWLIKNQQKERTVVDIAKKYIKENFNRNINMAEVANMVSMNYSYFSKLFKDQTGITFSGYLTQLRMEEAKKLLTDPQNRISEVSAKVGYDNIYHFSRAFKNYFGVSPRDFRKLGNRDG